LLSIEVGKGIDWATAEVCLLLLLTFPLSSITKRLRALQAMAFGSLMLEGYDVRISGQDVGRGTFSHRHAMLVNQKTEGVIVPLNDDEVLGAPGRLELANSSLSEMAVLGVRFIVFCWGVAD
jgi:probable 2-oxoglutarate dehydrogenase E1 component DHKTD1